MSERHKTGASNLSIRRQSSTKLNNSARTRNNVSADEHDGFSKAFAKTLGQANYEPLDSKTPKISFNQMYMTKQP
jgi:hypothetical protein